MKKQIVLMVILMSNLACYGQNVLFLKNGDRLNGKLEGTKLDSLIFKLHGAKINFSSSDVLALFFDEKVAPNSISNLDNLKNNKESAKISGVVTYYFNSNYGDKPDIGAEIYVVDSVALPEFKYEDVKDFFLAIIYRDILVLSKRQKMPIPAFIQNQVVKLKLDDKVAFDESDKNAYQNIQKLMNSDKAIKTVADGSGNYSVKVAPGTYYVLIKSNNREGMTTTMISGKIFCEKHSITDGSELSINAKFDQ